MSWILIFDALQNFPAQADVLDTEKGNAILVKKDIFKNLMWYVLPDSNQTISANG